MTRKSKGMIIAAMVLLAVVAAWGWMRKPASAYANATHLPPTTTETAAAENCLTPVSYRPQAEPTYATRDYVRTLRPAEYQPVEGSPAPAYEVERDRIVERPAATRYVHRSEADRRPHERSKKKSVVIVAGSAAGGAAVGALAGGGKGAGIGALAGGVGGFVYDRLTHKH